MRTDVNIHWKHMKWHTGRQVCILKEETNVLMHKNKNESCCSDSFLSQIGTAVRSQHLSSHCGLDPAAPRGVQAGTHHGFCWSLLWFSFILHFRLLPCSVIRLKYRELGGWRPSFIPTDCWTSAPVFWLLTANVGNTPESPRKFEGLLTFSPLLSQSLD